MINDVVSWIEQNLQISPASQARLLATLAIIVVLLVLRRLAVAFVDRRTEEIATQYRWRKGIGYATLVVGIILVGSVWLQNAASLVTYLGLLSAALVIALQDPITNFVGWIFIIWRRPFSVGDRIEIGDHSGDVVDIRFFQFTLMEIRNWVDADQSTGRVLHLPNRRVFSDGVANFSRGFTYIWNEIPVTITFESDWAKAKTILAGIAERHAAHLSEAARERLNEAARRYMITYDKLTPIVYTKVIDIGVTLTLRYLCDPRGRRTSEHAVWEEILAAFAREPDIEFAYPTERIYYHPVEGRPLLRPEPAGRHPLEKDNA